MEDRQQLDVVDERQVKAQDYQKKRCWSLALAIYQDIDTNSVEHPGNKLNIALCLFELGQYAEALQFSLQSSKLEPSNWQAHHLTAMALRMIGRLPEALKLLAMLHRRHPKVAAIGRDYGDFVCKILGDWELANTIWQPIKDKVEYREVMNWFKIKRQIYDGAISTEKLNQDIIDFSRDHLNSYSLHVKRSSHPMYLSHEKKSSQKQRLKIGLISTFFRATPVYYLCFSALRHLSADFDLVFYARETIEDWATQEFKSIAFDWRSVKHLSSEQLAKFLFSEKLDVIIDMCGWLDRDALKALSTRPAKRLYKWVGGQSSSTGMSCFDGFITDQHQSPTHLQSYYTEPLLCFDAGYATYTAPPYLPAPCLARQDGRWWAGIISHPMKVSGPFLQFLLQHVIQLEDNADFKLNLRFIGWRYGQRDLQKRILRVFRPVFDKASAWLSIEFIPTQGHENFLKKVSQLDWVIDTFPYTSGVTALESIALGVPCRTRAGTLFSQRHAYSHCRYANIPSEDFDLDLLGPFTPPQHQKTGLTLLPNDCARLNHAQLASSLAEVLS